MTCVDQTTSVVGGCQGSNHTSTVLKLYYLTDFWSANLKNADSGSPFHRLLYQHVLAGAQNLHFNEQL